MAAFQPLFRATVFQPRSRDPLERTPLVPAAGAPHGDAFRVASAPGVDGYQPYLDAVAGRRGKITLSSAKLETGELRLKLLDKRVLPSGDQLARWLTAFTGDSAGHSALLGCRVQVETSLDGGATWAPYFVGRIESVALSSPLWFELVVRDAGEDLSDQIFTAAPDATVPYAAVANLMPYYQVQQSAQAAQRAAVATGRTAHPRPMYGAMGRTSPDGKTPLPTLEIASAYVNITKDGSVVSAAMRSLAADVERFTQRKRHWLLGLTSTETVGLGFAYTNPKVRVKITRTDTKQVGDAQLVYLNTRRDKATGKFYGTQWVLTNLPASDVSFLDVNSIPQGTICEWSVYCVDHAAPSSPYFVGDVHPVQLLADILDGKYSPRNADGSLRPIAGRDAAAWQPLLADPSYPPVRFVITEPAKANEWIEKNLLLPMGLVYRVDGSGAVVLTDVRRRSDYAGTPTITDADVLVGEKGRQQWSQVRSTVIRRLDASYWLDTALPPDQSDGWGDTFPEVTPGSVLSEEQLVVLLEMDGRALDLGAAQSLRLGGEGFRYTAGEDAGAAKRSELLIGWLKARAADLQAYYAVGSMQTTITCRRGGPGDCWPGDFRYVQVSTLPDPTSNRRGGTRLMLCVERQESGLGVAVGFLDLGLNVACLPPSLGAPAVVNNAASVTFAPGTPGDAVAVCYAVTPGGTLARPADNDPAWIYLGRYAQPGTATASGVGGGRRVWFRARAESPEGGTRRLPSAWVGAAGFGFADVAGLAAPRNVHTDEVYAARADVLWDVGEPTCTTEVLLTTGGAPVQWLPTDIVALLPPGTNTFRLRGLLPTAQHTVALRHRDAYGGESATVPVTFWTTSTAAHAPRPAAIDLAIP